MINAIADHAQILDSLDVPMVTLIIRKAYGAAYYFLGMGAFRFPVRCCLAQCRDKLHVAPDRRFSSDQTTLKPEKKVEAMCETAKILELGASIWDSAYEFWIDAVILPETTRKIICHAFSFLTKAPNTVALYASTPEKKGKTISYNPIEGNAKMPRVKLGQTERV